MRPLGGYGLVGFLVVFLVWPGPPAVSAGGGQKISWQKPFLKDGATIIPGSVRSAHGTFEFRWVVDRKGEARLLTLVPFGAGELPPQETELFLLVRRGGATLIFQEWWPLVNMKEPPCLRLVAEVSTVELFAVLPAGRQPPEITVGKKPRAVLWREQERRDGIICLPGVIEIPGRRLEIVWKKRPGHLPELFFVHPAKNGKPISEEKLFLWRQEGPETTVICRQARPSPEEGFVAHLQPLAAVKTGELLQGFHLLDD